MSFHPSVNPSSHPSVSQSSSAPSTPSPHPTQSPEYTARLQALMQAQGIPSFRNLSQRAGISEKAITRLRRGHLPLMKIRTLTRLASALEISIEALFQQFSQEPTAPPAHHLPPSNNLQGEYDRLVQQLQQQREQLWQEFQQTSLQTLEPWLLQWSAAVHAAQKNPQLPAVNLIPLVRPVETLLQQWGLLPIGTVGDEIPFDPHQHQLMAGSANPGDQVRIRYSGYRQGEKLLYRAKVSPIE
ncbi:helix-turn-helix domain-containing protein [Alkalinema sp. FACHB-956]|uniref:helix-turn-helix domain-containing protein n=1 Tax=Alkalinema sp. FACHB-956 TaxID=2692768 RepID=UPI001683AAC5|nr:helix-turn-helix domain-containing protein [Alkalinema sp. FACHB-956]MBD2327442.1 helix-turn-helix domain-containing protein [Alkalinema sp. FACHB-956]